MSDTSFCAGARDGKSGPCIGTDSYKFHKANLINKKHFSGDSGGGMVLKVDKSWRIVGIISAAVGKFASVDEKIVQICDLNNHLVYTDVSNFREWIEQVVLETLDILYKKNSHGPHN